VVLGSRVNTERAGGQLHFVGAVKMDPWQRNEIAGAPTNGRSRQTWSRSPTTAVATNWTKSYKNDGESETPSLDFSVHKIRIGAGKGRVNIVLARKTVREMRAKRGGRIEELSRAELERILGHFGPPVKTATKRRNAAKKVPRKRGHVRKTGKKRAA
jgi:hypothetical protein